MSRPYHEWTSRDIAMHANAQRARDAMASAGPWKHAPRSQPRRFPWLALWFAAFALAGTLAVALAGSPAPDMPHGPGWEQCGKEWRC